MPVSDVNDSELGRDLIAYQVAHNHPKIFMTGGYAGTGYETVLFEDTSSGAAHRYAGDNVKLDLIGRERLSEGRIMVYRPMQDVHYQEHPEEFSISINVISETAQRARQYLYDINERTIAQCVNEDIDRPLALLDAARLVHSNDTLDLLDELITSHDNPQVRVECARTFIAIAPERRSTILSLLSSYKHQVIQNFVRLQEESA